METNDKHELSTVKVHDRNSPAAVDSPKDGSSALVAQTRTRRLFSLPQLFSFSLVYMATWYCVAMNMYFALANGGPAAWFWSYLIVAAGALSQAATFGELASIQPVAGAQYYWTWTFSPPKWRRFLTWIQGWFTWTGYVALLTSCLNGNTVVLEGIVQLGSPGYSPGGWHTTLIMFATVAFCAGVNLFAFRLVPWFEVSVSMFSSIAIPAGVLCFYGLFNTGLLSGVLNICLVLIYLVVLWVMSPRNSPNIFLVSSIASGWDNYFVSANLGALSSIFLFCAFESVVHMGEETRDAKRAVPRAVFWSVATNVALGLVMIITFGICMPSTDILLDSSSPIVTILLNTTGSTRATTAMTSGIVILGISGNMGVLSSVSRLTWAWARDGGLPQYFGHVDAKHRVPSRAVVLVSMVVLLLSLLNIGGSSYIALSAIVSLSSMAIYLSYTIILAVVLHARLNNRIQFGVWNFGRAGTFLNVFALAYTVYAIIWLPFPNYLPVTAANMNYSGPVFGVVLIGAVTLWFARGRSEWDGPNKAVVDYVLRDES